MHIEILSIKIVSYQIRIERLERDRNFFYIKFGKRERKKFKKKIN